MNSLSVIIPLFNREPAVVDYVIRDLLKQDIDEVVLANTGKAKIGFKHSNVLEVWNPLPVWLPGITRNMGAVVANGNIQVHIGADIITASGTWDEFRRLDDNTTASAPCGQLDANQTQKALAGARNFNINYHLTSGAVFGLTKKAALFPLKGPFDWEMRGWGHVDVDLKKRVLAYRLKHNILQLLRTFHLHHVGGSCDIHKSVSSANCNRNHQLMDAKAHSVGWWSGLTTRKQIITKGAMTMPIDTDRTDSNSLATYGIFGTLDFHTYESAAEYLRTIFRVLKPDGEIRVSFNDMDILGSDWPKAHKKTSHGQLRQTFWTPRMVQDTLREVGFEDIKRSDIHLIAAVRGISTFVAVKPKPIVVPEAPKRRRGRPRKPKAE